MHHHCTFWHIAHQDYSAKAASAINVLYHRFLTLSFQETLEAKEHTA